MATGGYDLEMDPIGGARNYPLPDNYDRDIGETSFSNPSFEDASTYNTSDNSSLNSDSTFTSQEVPVPVKSINEIYNDFWDLYSRDERGELETYKMSYLRNPKFTDGTKWRFTVTNRLELVDDVYTYEEIFKLANHANLTSFDNAGITVPYINDDYRQRNSLFMIGIDRGGKMNWVRITDNYGK